MYSDLLLERLAAMREAEDDARIIELIDEIEELDSLISPEARELSRDLRPHIVTDDVYEELEKQESFGDRTADRLATFAGSWRFILIFAGIMIIWMAINGVLGTTAFDPFPFILLNLTLSTLAALQAPVILMSQNRQGEKDRAIAQNDYQVNLKNELELADLHRKIDDLSAALLTQTRLVNALVLARRQELSATVRAIEKTRNQESA